MLEIKKIKPILKELKRYKSFVITTHIGPEGDALGSELAIGHLLRAMGKSFCIINSERAPLKYNFLPGYNMIKSMSKKIKRYEAICFLDCTDLQRAGKICKILDLKRPIINIDHHISNTKFGSINCVMPDASSVGEIIYMLFKQAKIKIKRPVAECLYTAILTDTGSFSYQNTSPFTHRVISELLDTGVRAFKIYKKIYEQFPHQAMRLLGCVLSGLKLSKDGRIAWIYITKDMFKKNKASLDDVEDFINFPRSIKGVELALCFVELPKNRIKVNMRSSGKIDVSTLASHFGGGGHPCASGCLLKGPLRKAEKRVLSAARQEF